MGIKSVAKECGLYITGVVLSCGASQVYGLVKGTIDLVKQRSLQNKIKEWQALITLSESDKRKALCQSKVYKLLKHSDPHASDKVLFDRILEKAKGRIFDLTEKNKLIDVSLKKDATSLIPVVGAIFAWRVGAGKDATSLKASKGIKHATTHMLGSHKHTIQKLFYPATGKEIDRVAAEGFHVKIPVYSRTSPLDAIFLPPEGRMGVDPTAPTVVLFHGNAMNANDMYDQGLAILYQKKGYNVLIPTMGGYSGSGSIKTSEASTYQDVEAVKKYLESQGITQAGYHGLSIGGSLAMQAAAGESESNVETTFVVADQTFSSVVDVAQNVVRGAETSFTDGISKSDSRLERTYLRIVRFAASFFKENSGVVKGAVEVAFPKMKVMLSDKLVVETDGLDNVRKAKILKARKVPLYVIKTAQDSMMGSSKGIAPQDKIRYEQAKKQYDAAYVKYEEDLMKYKNELRAEEGQPKKGFVKSKPIPQEPKAPIPIEKYLKNFADDLIRARYEEEEELLEKNGIITDPNLEEIEGSHSSVFRGSQQFDSFMASVQRVDRATAPIFSGALG